MRKGFLSILFILIISSLTLLILLVRLDIDELKLYYSKYKNNLEIYTYKDSKIGEYECSFSDNCFLAYSPVETILDVIVKTDESKKSIEMTLPVVGNFAFVVDGIEVNFVNLDTGDIESSYKAVKYLGDYIVSLKNDDNKFAYAYIINNGLNLLSDFKYDYIGMSDYSRNLLVSENNEYYITNESGHKLSSNFNYIYNYTDDYVVAKSGDYFYLADYDGNKLINDSYSMIKLDGEYIYVVQNNLMNVYDSEFNLLNDTEISLGTVVNWTTYYVYNEYYRFLYESSVFTTTLTEDSLSIYANEQQFILNIN